MWRRKYHRSRRIMESATNFIFDRLKCIFKIFSSFGQRMELKAIVLANNVLNSLKIKCNFVFVKNF